MSKINFDLSRGVDVMRGAKVLAHFDGEGALAQAWAWIGGRGGLYVRYWAA